MKNSTDKRLYNSETCPCSQVSCKNYKKCEDCIKAHHDAGGKTSCERLYGDDNNSNDPKEKSGFKKVLSVLNDIFCPT